MKIDLKIRRPIIIFPIILAFFPLLNLYLQNFALVEIKEIILPGIIILVAYLLIWKLSEYLIKNRAKTALITSIFFILFFSYGHFLIASTNYILRFTGIDLRPVVFNDITWKFIILLITWIAIFGLLVILVLKINSEFQITIQFLNFVSIALLIIMVFQATRGSLLINNLDNHIEGDSINIDLIDQISKNEIADTYSPDIYYIILDGYGNSNVLEKYHDLDNEDFISHLTDRGFYVSDNSHSNYLITVASLSSSLNMRYLDEVAEEMGNTSQNPLPLINLIRSPEIIDSLKSRGYEITAIETGFGATELTSADNYISSGKHLSPFQIQLISLTPLQIWLNGFLYDSHRNRIRYIFDEIPNAANPDQKSFVFSHITSPHPPFVFDSNGESDNPDMIYSPDDANLFTDIAGQEEYKKRYKNQVLYLNLLVEETVDRILEKSSKKPIIIIQGDHGPGSEFNWESLEDSAIDERKGILNAYYFPDQDYSRLYEKITPVNTFRIILDQYFGTDLGLLDDRSFFSTLSEPYNFIDVTEELNSMDITD